LNWKWSHAASKQGCSSLVVGLARARSPEDFGSGAGKEVLAIEEVSKIAGKQEVTWPNMSDRKPPRGSLIGLLSARCYSRRLDWLDKFKLRIKASKKKTRCMKGTSSPIAKMFGHRIDISAKTFYLVRITGKVRALLILGDPSALFTMYLRVR